MHDAANDHGFFVISPGSHLHGAIERLHCLISSSLVVERSAEEGQQLELVRKKLEAPANFLLRLTSLALIDQHSSVHPVDLGSSGIEIAAAAPGGLSLVS